MDRDELMRMVHTLDPIVRIGKSGVNPKIIAEMKKHLKKRKIIKVKFLKSSMQEVSVADLAQKVATDCNAIIIKRTGFVVTYAIQGLPIDGRRKR